MPLGAAAGARELVSPKIRARADRPFRALAWGGLILLGATLALAGARYAAERGPEADRSAIVALSTRWVAAVANHDPAFPELVSSRSEAHYRRLKHFALHADSETLRDLSPTDQLQALFFRLMIEPAALRGMTVPEILLFAVDRGMIGQDLRASDELREVVVTGDLAQGRLYKFGRDDRADRSLQYFERENGEWRIDLRGELQRLRNDFDAFVVRSKLPPDEAAFFILEARLFRKVTPADFVPAFGAQGEPTPPPGSAHGNPQEELEIRIVSIRKSLVDPAHEAVAIEDRRESLRHVLRLGDPLPPAPRFILTHIEDDHATLHAGSEPLTLRLEEDGPPLDQRLPDQSSLSETRPVSLLRHAELGVARGGLMAQWRNVGLRGRPQLLQQAWLTPVHRSDGRMLGLRVRKLVEGSFWHQIGLEENDLLTNFNGLPVDSMVAWRGVLRAAQTDLQITTEVERAGETIRFRTRTIRP